MKRSLSLLGGMLGTAVALTGSTAQAHIDMLGALKSRGGDQKAVPCDGARSAGTVYTFEPGAFITLGVTESITHDSYFRIAFDNDGEDGFKEPASIDPINPNRVSEGGSGTPKPDNKKCMTNAADKCGQSDFCNVTSATGATVLWDNIDPHLGAESADTYTWTIQLPNVECENCTLQVLQVMEDIALGFHGPFDGNEDIYHRCINIKLKKGAGTTGPGNAASAAVKVGTANAKYPDANKSCVGASTTSDAGVGSPDAGLGSDAGVAANDAGAPKPDAGAVGAPGGTSGTLAGAGGTLAGSAGGGASGTQGGTSPTGTTGGSAPTAGGTAGGSTTGGTTGGLGTTTGGVGTGATDDDNDGCSIALGGSKSSAAGWLGVGVFALILARRSRRRA